MFWGWNLHLLSLLLIIRLSDSFRNPPVLLSHCEVSEVDDGLDGRCQALALDPNSSGQHTDLVPLHSGWMWLVMDPYARIVDFPVTRTAVLCFFAFGRPTMTNLAACSEAGDAAPKDPRN